MWPRRDTVVPLHRVLRRAEAVVNVLSEDLGQPLPRIHPPGAAERIELTEVAQARARAELQAVERDLHRLESLAHGAEYDAREWQERAARAQAEGRVDAAAHAQLQASQSLREANDYAGEIRDARALVEEWSIYLAP